MSENSIEEIIEYNNYKIIADKILKTLTNIRNVAGISSKRWIWELIQNAKDVKNNFYKVKIKIELDKNYLRFSHNGSFFTINDVLGILQQVSSKNSKNLHQTGKFGTGFIGTHLLSNKITINGVVQDKTNFVFKKFKIYLDRSADSSEELLKEVKNSILNFKKNMISDDSEYQTLEIYKQNEDDFDTTFEFKLENEESVKIAKDGLSDLINTAPITLATQYQKISSITIIDRIKNEETDYNVNCSLKNTGMNLNTVTIKSNNIFQKLYFYSYESENSRLFYQIEKSGEGFCVHERAKGQPILFRDFPLIGSENFHFPFFFDGFKFHPLETRNGLYLNGNLNKEARENRKIIEDGIKLSIEFCKKLMKQNIDKRYLLANTRIPEPPQKYDEFSINWFINQQKLWRKDLIELELLRDEEGIYNELKLLKIPIFKTEFNKKFCDLFRNMNIAGGIIPHSNEVELWYEVMEKDPLKEVYNINENTWNFNFLFNEENLFQKINDYGTIFNFAEKMKKGTDEIYDWLNKLYNFLKENNCNDCFYKYNLIPNQNGDFRKIYELYGNDNNKFPNIFRLIYEKIFGIDLNDILLHEKINLSLFGNNLKIKNFNNIINEFSDFLKATIDKDDDSKQKAIEEKKKYLVNQFLSFDIENKKIEEMFIFRSQTDKIYNKKKKIKIDLNESLLKHNIWNQIEDYWFNYHSDLIQSYENIENLKQILINEEDKKHPLKWLDKYFYFLKSYSTIILKKKIFPNQNGNFRSIENLQTDDFIPEILKDILNKLKKIDDKNYDIRDLLLSKEIKSYEKYNKFSLKEIIFQIEKLFKEAKGKDNFISKTKTEIAERMISYCYKGINQKEIEIFEGLKKLIELYNILLNKNLIINEAPLTIEINYGIFANYILKIMMKKIEKMNIKEVQDNSPIIPKIIKYSWDYQFNYNLNILLDPKKYKIFSNRNNELKEIKQIYFRDWNNMYRNVEKELFELSKNSIINKNYNDIILSPSYEICLIENRTQFKIIKFSEICQKIDSSLINYFNNNDIQNNEEFIFAFNSLNSILKSNPSLRHRFPQFIKERSKIVSKFTDEKEIDIFIEGVMKKIIRNKSYKFKNISFNRNTLAIKNKK